MNNHLFLDIDGVLNAVGALNTLPKTKRPWSDYQLVEQGTRFNETYSPTMIKQLKDLIEKHRIKVHWLSTWEEDAHEFGIKIGLAQMHGLKWPYLDTEDQFGVWGKHRSLRLHNAIHRERGDRIAWIDDDLRDEYEAQLWASESGILTIAPNPHQGITPAHLHILNEHYTKD